MLIKIMLVASALLSSTTLVVAQVMAPDFTSGRCGFDAIVSQDCDKDQITTFLDVSPVYDGAGNEFMEKTDSIDLTDGLTLTSVVVGKELKIGFERDSVGCEYCRKSAEISNRTDARKSFMATLTGPASTKTTSSAAPQRHGTAHR